MLCSILGHAELHIRADQSRVCHRPRRKQMSLADVPHAAGPPPAYSQVGEDYLHHRHGVVGPYIVFRRHTMDMGTEKAGLVYLEALGSCTTF
jgi:hypothetical protein